MVDEFMEDNSSKRLLESDEYELRSEIEEEHATISFRSEGEVRRVLIVNEDPYPASAIEYQAVAQLRAIRALKQAVFLAVIATRNGWVTVDRSGPGILIHRLGDLISLRCHHFVYDPHLEVLFQVLKGLGIIENESFGDAFHEYSRTNLHESEVALRNEFLSDIQLILQSDEFKKVLSSRRKSAKRIYRAFDGIWRSSFSTRSRVMIVRVDFEYSLHGEPEGFHPLHSTQVPDRFLLEVFLADRDRFINNFRYHQGPDRFAEHLLAWGWKLECGQKRGWHIHAVFFFDASRVKNAWYMAEMLGDLWERLTEGRGSYFNVHRAGREYQRRFIGLIHRGDKEAEAAYRKYLRYLSKDDQIPVVKTSQKLQMFAVSRGLRHEK